MKYIENRIKSINTITVNSKRCGFCYSKFEDAEVEDYNNVDYSLNYERSLKNKSRNKKNIYPPKQEDLCF
jgi:hypothetical protein